MGGQGLGYRSQGLKFRGRLRRVQGPGGGCGGSPLHMIPPHKSDSHPTRTLQHALSDTHSLTRTLRHALLNMTLVIPTLTSCPPLPSETLTPTPRHFETRLPCNILYVIIIPI